MRTLALFVLSLALIMALTPQSARACVPHQVPVCVSIDCTMNNQCEEGQEACALCCATACAVAAALAENAAALPAPPHPHFARSPSQRVRIGYRSHDPPVPRLG